MERKSFFLENRKFLLFGLLLTLFSTFGQTSFLSIFTPYLQDHFHLTPGKAGMIYSAATLFSAVLLSCTGKWIDRIDLKRFTLFVTILFALSCLSMALTSSLIILFMSYFLLRYTCQGLMCHISMVSMARYYEGNRGKALSIAALGYPLGDACLPIGIAFVLHGYGFAATWLTLTAFACLVIIPVLMYLLNDHGDRHQNYLNHLKDSSHESAASTPKDVLKDWRFYLVVFGVLAPGFINTGIFFQNAELIQSKHWPQYIYAASLVNYALGNVLGSFISGILIDRFKAVRIVAFYLLPMFLGLFVLYSVQPVWAIYVFMLGIGLSQGASSVIIGAIWVELYGSKHLGTIRSWVSSLKVLFTAISPMLFGYLLDHHVTFSHILLACVCYVACSIGSLATVGLQLKKSELVRV
jgi:MFS family permease